MTAILNLPLVSAPIAIATNEDWVDGVMFVEADETTPVDLTGIAFSFMVRRRVTDAVAILYGSTEDGRMIAGGVTGTLNFNVPAVVMEQVFRGEGFYDVRAFGDGHTRRVMTGAIIIELGVDRWHDVPAVAPPETAMIIQLAAAAPRRVVVQR